MAHPVEPLPPGIVPNFPPHYPMKWQHRILPEPHPNHLRSLGLPTSFSTYNKRSNPGYGGYEYCNEFEGPCEPDSVGDDRYYDPSIEKGSTYTQNGTDEYDAYDDDPDWQCLNQVQSFSQHQNFPAPVPTNKNHYYNLAPKHEQYNLAPPRKNRVRNKHKTSAFGCDSCDMSFISRFSYEQHVKEHIECPYPGCNVAAIMEELDNHITNAHLLSSAAKCIDNPSYVAARKRNFPCSERYLLQQALKSQKRKRGELLGSSVSEPRNLVTSPQSVLEDTVQSHVDSKEYEPLNIKQNQTKSSSSRTSGRKARVSHHKESSETNDFFPVFPRIPPFEGIEDYPELPQFSSCQTKKVNKYEEKAEETVTELDISDDEDVNLSCEKPILSQSSVNDSFLVSSKATLAQSGECSEISASLKSQHEMKLEENTVTSTGALSCLMNDYGTDSEDEANNENSRAAPADISRTLSPCLQNNEKQISHIEENAPCCLPSKKENCSVSSCIEEKESDLSCLDNLPKSRKKRRRRHRSKTTNVDKVDSSLNGEDLVETNLTEKNFIINSTVEEQVNCVLPQTNYELALANKYIKKKYKVFRNKYGKSLLEQLLSSQIRHERNVLIQCAKYIADNNYFEGNM